MSEIKIKMPGYDFFTNPVDVEIVKSVTAEGGFRTLCLRRQIFVGDDFASGAKMIEELELIHETAPNVDLLVHFQFWPAQEWMLKNGGEAIFTYFGETVLCRTWDRAHTGPYEISTPTFHQSKRSESLLELYENRAPSPFSMLYAEEMANFIEEFFSGISTKSVRRRIVSVFLGAYRCGEWNNDQPATEHGPCAVKYFREWLSKKYKAAENLKTSWSDESVDFNNALPPVEKETPSVGNLLWLDARRHDYKLALADALCDQLLRAVQAVRQRAPELRTGCFWPNSWLGHQARMDRVLKDVDFIATPLTYYNRHPGGAHASQSLFHQTPSTRNRLFLDEVDTRTHVVSDKQICHGRAADEDESIELLWRDMIMPLAQGNMCWQLDFSQSGTRKDAAGPGWIPGSLHTTPRLLAEHKKINSIWQNQHQLDLTPVSEVRVFTPMYFAIVNHRGEKDMVAHAQEKLVADEWSRAGLPVSYYALEDLLEGRVSLGKLNIFYSCSSLRQHDYDQLLSILENSKTTCLWIMGAGLLEPGNGNSPSMEKMNVLTGISQEIVYENGVFSGTFIKTSRHPFADGLGNDTFGQLERPVASFYGQSFSRETPQKPSPVNLPYKIIVKDKAASHIGRFLNQGDVCLAMKHVNGFTSIAYNLPILPARLLRSFASYSGAHVYVDSDDCLWATRGLLAHHACGRGTRKLTFPDKRDRVDLRGDKVLSENASELVLELEIGQTSIIGTKKIVIT